MTSEEQTALAAAEAALHRAMLGADTAALERLLSVHAAYVGPDGAVVTREQDLHHYASGWLQLISLVPHEPETLVFGDTGVTRIVLDLTGRAGGQPFTAIVRYTRTWHRTSSGWTVLAAHGSACTTKPRDVTPSR